MSTASIDDLLSRIPVDQLAARLDVDPDQVRQAAGSALPAILGGMRANAEDPAGERSLAGALTQHSPALVEGGVDLDQVDTSDGEKVVANVFGANKDQVVAALSGTAGSEQSLVQKLLPVLAPIVLSYLSKQVMGGGRASEAAQGQAGGGAPSGGLGDLLGGILGGGGGASGAGGLDIGSVLGRLGGLLGGGKR